MGVMRVAYTLEQCWHDAPGGTAVAAIEVARRLAPRTDVTLVGVAGRHRSAPKPDWRAPIPVAQLPLPRPLLYESWLRLRRPRVEQATGPVDVSHATGLVPCATDAPLVVTMHDVAFLDDTSKFSRQGLRVMRRSLDVTRDRAAMVITSSEASRRDLEANGVEPARIRVVPLGVDHAPASSDAIAAVRQRHSLPERFVLFVGTLEPRKNLRRLAAANEPMAMPLVVAGPAGWGDATDDIAGDVRFLGFVPRSDLPGAVRGGDGLRLSQRVGGIRPAGAGGDEPGCARRDEHRHLDRGGRRRRRRPRRPVRCRLDRCRSRPRPSVAPTSCRRPAAPEPPTMTWDAAAERTLDVYREVLGERTSPCERASASERAASDGLRGRGTQ